MRKIQNQFRSKTLRKREKTARDLSTISRFIVYIIINPDYPTMGQYYEIVEDFELDIYYQDKKTPVIVSAFDDGVYAL